MLCYNDFYGPNFLMRGDEMRLIDWEYAAMGDPMSEWLYIWYKAAKEFTAAAEKLYGLR